MPDKMSKRKREDSSDGDGTLYTESTSKRNRKENLEKDKYTVNERITEETKQKEEEKFVEPGSSKSELDQSVSCRDDKPNGKLGKKRKRQDSVEDKEKDTKYIKTDLENDKFKAEETTKEPKSKKIFKKRISRNECVCTPVGTQPLEKPEEDTDAHIQVEEWRLHKFQSPIELKHEESIHHDHFDPLEFHGHWDESGNATLTNNGFTATLRFYDRELPMLKGGPLHEDEYIFEQLHFHWSEDDHSGCEHIFEGRAYSMEVHAVHFNRKYADFKEAHDKPDGLAVVAFFIQATDNEDNPCFNKLSTAVKDIIKINTTTSVPTDCLTWFKEEAQCKGYYTYQGSLTTEPYTESVTWILYPQPLHVSREQVASFRSLHSTPCEQHNIKKNVRPIQTPPEHKKLNVFFARSHRHSTSE